MKKLLYLLSFLLVVFMGTDAWAQSQTNLDKGMRFIEKNAQKWGLQESDYANTLVSDMYTNKKNGLTYIYLVQAHNGIPIHNAITPLVIGKDGIVRTAGHGYISNIKEKITSTSPSIAPVAAIKSAAADLGIIAKEMPALQRSNKDKNTYEFGKAEFAANDIKVKLTYVLDGDELKLAWNLAIDELDNPDYYSSFVDANSGEVISKFNYTVKCTFHKGQYDRHVGCSKDHGTEHDVMTFAEATAATSTAGVTGGTYNVFALPIESPIYGERSLQVSPFLPDSSPFGWHDIDGAEGAEFTITRGNNVHAYLDKMNTGFSEGDEPDGGADLIFDLPYVVDNEARENEAAATVNLFYANNMIHDITKRLGFDEQAGNFQVNNYGNGGSGNDEVMAQASDGIDLAAPTLDNANFATPPDGSSGQMQMYLWENPSGIISVDEPAEISGFIGDVILANGWGAEAPDETQAPITGKVVLARENAPGEPTTVCGPVLNAAEVAGNIAMVDRGLCDFSLKAFNAQEAGAISIIICNVEGGSQLGAMGGGERNEEVTIFPILLPKVDCDRIKASILSDIDVTMTIQNRGPVGPQYRDGSVDNGIVLHEYGHGISNRSIGGGNNTGCMTNSEQAGEGISDYFTLVLTVQEGDAGETPRGIGNYAVSQNTNGDGIRSFPYSTDMSINPLVFDDIKTRTGSVHATGEVWCAVMWDIYWDFVNRDGLDVSWENEEAGNYKAVRLAIEGMKLSSCNASMIDLRDGVLLADSVLYGAANGELLWKAFARRGFGYLANDGGTSDNAADGTQNFDPFPLVIQELKIEATTEEVVAPGEEVTVDLKAINHIPETQNGVVITVNIPEGLSYVEGSASMDAMHDNGVLTIELGDMEYEDEVTLSYRATASSQVNSKTYFYDDVDNADFGAYDFGVFEGTNIWSQSFDVANSGSVSWWAAQPNVDEETDFWMTMPLQDVFGERPALRFANRFDTETGADGGFIQLSTDGEIFFDVKDKFIRNGYTSDIQYPTFAIPLLEAFSGTTNGEFIDSYLDLRDYIGQEVHIRFRFGTDDNTGVEADVPGWLVDDLEIVDLATFETFACISSENSTVEQCTDVIEIFVESDQMIDTNVEELEGFELKIAPNPASDYVSVGISSEENTPIQLLLTSIDGTVVRSMNMVSTSNESVRTFDTSDLQSGMYLIQIKSDRGLTTKKIIIQ